MVNITMRQGEEEAVLTLNGELTISHAARIQAALLDAFRNTSALCIELRGISDIDASALQLLCAAHRSAVLRKIRFRIDAGGEAKIADVAFRSGFPRHVGCWEQERQTCLWICGQEGPGLAGTAGAGV